MASLRSVARAANPIGTRVHQPLRLGAITYAGTESDGSDLGLKKNAADRIWTAAEALYRTGLHPAISLVVRRHGEVVVDRAIGTLHFDGGGQMTTDTPACLFSCSKSITALILHRLAEDGQLTLDDPVGQHLPDFASESKRTVTLRALLTHRAGLNKLPVRNPDPAMLFDAERMLAAIADAPLSRKPRQAYHAVTSGYILGAVAEKVSGKSMHDLLREYVTDPVGAPTVTYGVPEDRRDAVALSYSTGPTHLAPYSTLVRRLLGVPPHLIAPEMNTAAGMSAVLPAANAYASAHDACRIFQMLGDGGVWDGRQILAPETLAAALEPGGPLVIDASLPAPIRFSAGFMLGERVASLYGINTPNAFGHLGFTNIVCWADPSRALSAAFINTGKAVSPEGFAGMAAVTAAISANLPPLEAD
ncbi:MAG TPA: serine hydrolase domain-containing protein [Jatrophihabitantaceae bacterium]|nr:serine hydrolase domain-containing protein [Jatrophihabitantaceae bacterium]